MFVEQVELHGFACGTKRQAYVKLCMAQKNKLQQNVKQSKLLEDV